MCPLQTRLVQLFLERAQGRIAVTQALDIMAPLHAPVEPLGQLLRAPEIINRLLISPTRTPLNGRFGQLLINIDCRLRKLFLRGASHLRPAVAVVQTRWSLLRA